MKRRIRPIEVPVDHRPHDIELMKDHEIILTYTEPGTIVLVVDEVVPTNQRYPKTLYRSQVVLPGHPIPPNMKHLASAKPPDVAESYHLYALEP